MFPLNLNTLPAGAQELISELALEPFALRSIYDYGLLWYSPAPGVEGFRTDSGEVCQFTSPSFVEESSSHFFQTEPCSPASNFLRKPEYINIPGDFYQLTLPFHF